MTRIISVNSFRRGAGRSNLAANLAALLAQTGQRVAIIDDNLQTPSLHILFGLDEATLSYTFNDYLWGRCSIEQAVYDVTPQLRLNHGGGLFLIPASPKMEEIKRVLRYEYDVNLLDLGCRQLAQSLKLGTLLIDTEHGLNQATMLAVAIADVLVLLLRTDQQDYRGTDLTIQVARKLDVPQIVLLVNETPKMFDFTAVKARVERAYACEVTAVLPHVEEMMALASSRLFVLHYPDHPLTQTLKQIAAKVAP
ncbi:MAG: MinD/ParA family protein [Chloroflexota bacterium]